MIIFRGAIYLWGDLVLRKESPFFIGLKNTVIGPGMTGKFGFLGDFGKLEIPHNLNGTMISFATEKVSVPFIVNGNELYFWAGGTSLGGELVVLRCHICRDGHMETNVLWHSQSYVAIADNGSSLVLNDAISVAESMQPVHPEVESWGPPLEQDGKAVLKLGDALSFFRVLIPETYPIRGWYFRKGILSSKDILNDLKKIGIHSYSLTVQNGIRQWVDHQRRIMDMEQFLSDLHRNTTFFL